MTKKEITNNILEALNQIRPFLEKDGGDIKLISVSDDFKKVEVELLGTCKTCSMSAMTMRAGVEEAIKKVAPQVERVEAIDLTKVNA
ncbi:MAG: NifU family protein [Vicingaceae bacterium]